MFMATCMKISAAWDVAPCNLTDILPADGDSKLSETAVSM
jgi:hypothetical protein